MLCKSHTTSEARTGWRVVKQYDGRPAFNIPKAMVTSLYGHEDMIDYMSSYRAQDKFKGKHYVPKGALFWFTCNQYGDFTGSCFFIKNVPDEELMKISYMGTGYRKIIKKKKKVLTMLERLNKDDRLVEYNTVKPKLKQKGK